MSGIEPGAPASLPDRRLREREGVRVAATVSAGVENGSSIGERDLGDAGRGASLTSTGCYGAFSPAHWLDGPLPLVAEITPAALAALALRAGDAVWASAKATKLETYPR